MKLLSCLLFFLSVPAFAQMGVRGALTYSSCTHTSSPSTQTCSFTASAVPQAGDAVFVFIQGNNTGFRVSSISYNGAAFSQLCAINNTGGAATQRTEVWYTIGVNGGGGTSMSITYTATTDRISAAPVVVYGYDTTATPVCGTNQGTSNTASASVTVPSANTAGTLLVAGFGQMSAAVIFSAGTNYTLISNSYRNCVEYRSMSTVNGTSQTATCSSSTSTYWSGAVVAIKESSGTSPAAAKRRTIRRY